MPGHKVTVSGYRQCGKFVGAKELWRASGHEVVIRESPTRAAYHALLRREKLKGPWGQPWTTSPHVVVDGTVIGGHDESVAFLAAQR